MSHLKYMRVPHTPAKKHTCAILCSVCLAISGCWGASDSDVEPDLEPKELTTKEDALTTEVPEFDLVRLSKKLYQVGMYTVARDSFSSLKDRYPLGAYSTFAEIKLADTYFFNREYNDAAKSYESFLKNFPGHTDAAYVKLQAARSHVASSRGGGRDRQPLERGLALFDEIIKEFPGTTYADIAKDERAPVVTQLSSYDTEIIDFYQKLGNEPAVKDRQQKFQARWGAQIPHDPEGSGAPAKSQVALASLSGVASPPRPAETTEKELHKGVDVAPASAPSDLREGWIVIQSVSCHTGDIPFGAVELTQLPANLRHTETTPQDFSPDDGVIILSGLQLTARQRRFTCFTTDDLEIRENGDLALSSEKSVTVSVVENPPRILLSPRNN